MRILFSERARRDWTRLDRRAQDQLRRKLAFYITSGNPLKFAEKLRDFRWGSYRFRAGDYRIVFDFRENTIFVLRIGNRKDIYKT